MEATKKVLSVEEKAANKEKLAAAKKFRTEMKSLAVERGYDLSTTTGDKHEWESEDGTVREIISQNAHTNRLVKHLQGETVTNKDGIKMIPNGNVFQGTAPKAKKVKLDENGNPVESKARKIEAFKEADLSNTTGTIYQLETEDGSTWYQVSQGVYNKFKAEGRTCEITGQPLVYKGTKFKGTKEKAAKATLAELRAELEASRLREADLQAQLEA